VQAEHDAPAHHSAKPASGFDYTRASTKLWCTAQIDRKSATSRQHPHRRHCTKPHAHYVCPLRSSNTRASGAGGGAGDWPPLCPKAAVAGPVDREVARSKGVTASASPPMQATASPRNRTCHGKNGLSNENRITPKAFRRAHQLEVRTQMEAGMTTCARPLGRQSKLLPRAWVDRDTASTSALRGNSSPNASDPFGTLAKPVPSRRRLAKPVDASSQRGGAWAPTTASIILAISVQRHTPASASCPVRIRLRGSRALVPRRTIHPPACKFRMRAWVMLKALASTLLRHAVSFYQPLPASLRWSPHACCTGISRRQTGRRRPAQCRPRSRPALQPILTILASIVRAKR